MAALVCFNATLHHCTHWVHYEHDDDDDSYDAFGSVSRHRPTYLCSSDVFRLSSPYGSHQLSGRLVLPSTIGLSSLYFESPHFI